MNKNVAQIIKEFLDQSKTYDATKSDSYSEPGNLTWNAEGLLIMQSLFGGVAYNMTDWSLGQICQRLGKAAFPDTNKSLPVEYMRRIPKDLLAVNLNRMATEYNPKRDGEQFLIRTHGDNARAFLSTQYAIADNTLVLEKALEYIRLATGGTDNARVTNSYIDQDYLQLQVLLADVKTPDGPYGIGFAIRNGEVGNHRLMVAPVIKRAVCDNSIVVQKDMGMTQVHKGNSIAMAALLDFSLANVMGAMVEASGNVLDLHLKARSIQVRPISKIVEDFAKKYQWEDETKAAIFMGTENQNTLAGLVNGISYAAHHTGLSAEDQMSMEVLAGEILVAAPDSLFDVAMRREYAELALEK